MKIKMKPDKRVLTLRKNPMSPWLINGGLASQSQTLVGVAIGSLDLWDIGFQQQQQHAKKISIIPIDVTFWKEGSRNSWFD